MPRRRPQHRDASCGTSQGFFLTQDTSPLAIDYPSEQHWMPRFKPANASVGNRNNDNYQSEYSDCKHDTPREGDKTENCKEVRFAEPYQSRGVDRQSNLSDGTELDTSPLHREANSPLRISEQKNVSNIKIEPSRLSSERQKTYITHKNENFSYEPSFQSDHSEKSKDKRNAIPQKRRKEQNYTFQSQTNDSLSRTDVQPQQEEYLSHGVKYC